MHHMLDFRFCFCITAVISCVFWLLVPVPLIYLESSKEGWGVGGSFKKLINFGSHIGTPPNINTPDGMRWVTEEHF